MCLSRQRGYNPLSKSPVSPAEGSTVTLHFPCPGCDVPDRIALPGPTVWQCGGCRHSVDLPAHAIAADGSLTCCALCGNGQLYRMKDFPQWLGMSILAA